MIIIRDYMSEVVHGMKEEVNMVRRCLLVVTLFSGLSMGVRIHKTLAKGERVLLELFWSSSGALQRH